MRYAIAFGILLTVNGPALAQNRPALTWQGEVTGGATLFIQGNRVDVQGRDTGAVDRPTYRFRDALPSVAQNVDVRVVRGRGRVVVAEQPSAANQYTAIVDIRNNGRPQVYELEFLWDSQNQDQIRGEGRRNREVSRGRAAGPGQATWSGDVDQEVFIVFRGRRAFTTAVRGRNIGGEQMDFSSPLPRRDVAVNLSDIRGRGRVELLEQPNSQNGFAAKVRIIDDQSGSGTYSFTLTWEDGADSGVLSPSGSSPIASPGAGSVARWSARVDGTVRVSLRGDRASAQRLSGGPLAEERVSIGTPLPRRNIEEVDVRKISGRGDVRIIQRPSSGNDYTLIFEIEDDDASSDFYEVEIAWR